MWEVVVASRHGALESERPQLLPPVSLAWGAFVCRLASPIAAVVVSCCGHREGGLSRDQPRRKSVP
jgi:hypothetical protein